MMVPWRRLCLKWIGFAGLAGATFATFTGCGDSSRADATPEVLVFARGADAQKLDPADVDDGESITSLEQILEGLMGFKTGSVELEPRLAERYEISEDGLTYTFHLRPGVVFHDGTPLDAEAAAFSFRRQFDPEHPAHLPDASFQYWQLFFSDMTAIEVVDPMTLRFQFSRPNASLLYAFASFPAYLISPQAFQTYGAEIQRHPVGTGPFRFVAWRPNEVILYERFEDYWGEPKAGFPRLAIRSVPLNATRLAELKAGRIHGLTDIQPAELAELRADPQFTVYHRAGPNVGYLAFSDFNEILSDPEVRRAIALAIDREALVELALDGFGSVAEYPLPPESLGKPTDEPPLHHDPAAARELLAKHPELEGVTLRLATFAEPRTYFPDPARIASLIRNDLEAVGLKVEIVNREFKRHLHLTRRGEFDMALLGWMADIPDPSNFLDTFFHSRAAQMGSATNISFYQNPEMDRLLEEALATTVPGTRQMLYEEALEIWARDLPLIPLVHGDQIAVFRREVKGYQLHPVLNHPLGAAYWEE